MEIEPTHDELREFIDAMLSNLDKSLREPEVIDEALRDHHDMWVDLYCATRGTYAPDAPP